MRLAVILLACSLLAGCRGITPGDPNPTVSGANPRSPRTSRYPFAPASLRVHPLTHVDLVEGEKGSAPTSEVVLHFELLDRYGDAVKGLGIVNVELYRPGPGANST